MRLIRFFLILLISVALPFTNVAAAAMVHCAQAAGGIKQVAAAQADDSGLHAHHHHAMQAQQPQQAKADHHQHHASGKSAKSGDACSQCSYCQSCAAAFFPAADSRMPSFSASDIKPGLVAGAAPNPHLDPLFRPPRLAFA
ncbi:hypothetical protein [Noviherbaspirillum autotrophicum]|uniref:DUF2946 domain-containing protein n=1 Tax=Noviherbaspirillum autotrophicum TaxID=709839 RepID=A0A0C2BPN0_9BURK|nr:hypothetical protein [Noviherbaspirillum autotrophicum]KIF80001.1 hypothetical protein TSA66_02935 [Noviherbaspirillum autotrophicum]